MNKGGGFFIVLSVLGMALPALAQNKPASGSQDVCCYGYTKENGTITTFTLFQSASSCQPGSKDAQGGRTICGSSSDLNQCSNGMSAETICTSCGFHWLKEMGTCSEKSLEELVPKDKDKAKTPAPQG